MDILATAVKTKEPLITVRTENLKERLNQLYDTVRGNSTTFCYWSRFDYLWDLKELAVLEGRSQVQIPDNWLAELERLFVSVSDFDGRSH